RDVVLHAAMIPSAGKKMPGSCEPGGTEETTLVAENFLLAAQTASIGILRKGSNFGYTTLVVGGR
ncbi:MAG: hypothetical protein ACYC1G_02180, partial [Thiobacillus sp.]